MCVCARVSVQACEGAVQDAHHGVHVLHGSTAKNTSSCTHTFVGIPMRLYAHTSERERERERERETETERETEKQRERERETERERERDGKREREREREPWDFIVDTIVQKICIGLKPKIYSRPSNTHLQPCDAVARKRSRPQCQTDQARTPLRLAWTQTPS